MAEDQLAFFSAQLLFWLLVAPEGHGKNFSIFLGSGGRFMLTPLYDIISAYPVLGSGKGQIHRQRLTMAMAVQGHVEWEQILPRHFVEMGKSFGVDMLATMENLARQIPEAIERVSKELDADFPQSVAQPTFEGLLAQGKRLEDVIGS